ncbi:MAG: AAA family ATPase, partial [Solirubrobacterales bacterium]|nr:AAA family ATPase [Solirubrobacterales bacterium]
MTVIPETGTRRERGSSVRPLLERESELAALSALIEDARSGDGQLVVVEGPAGIGKTRLLVEARLVATEFEVLSARGGELESDFALGIVRQLFEGALATAPADARAELLSGAAALAAPLFVVVPSESDEAMTETSFAVLHGLYWLAANFALRRPTLIAVDDLHWADEPSLRWLGYLAKRLEGLPLLVVAATRSPGQAHTPALVTEILADPLATVIRPGALGQASAATLAEELFGLQPDEDFAAALRDASGGNPLYLAAILDAVAREQIAPTAQEAPRLLEAGGEALARGVALRLSRLPGEAVALAQAAAILGDQTELALAASLAEVDTAAALEAAGALVHADLLECENPLAFRHPVVRSAVLEDLSVAERMRLQRRAAEVLLDNGALPEQAATYLMSTVCGRDGFVVDTLRRAAQRSLSQGAPEAAIAYLRRALDESPETAERREVLAELGIAETQAFASDDAALHLRQSLAGLDDIARRPDLILAYVNALSAQTESTREAFELLEQLSDRSRNDRGLHERVEAQLVIAAHYDPALYPGARQRWDGASERDAADPIEAGTLLAAGAFEEARRGVRPERAVELATRAVASNISSTRERLYYVDALWALLLAGRSDEALTAMDEALERSRRGGDRLASAAFYLFGARLRVDRGELLAAEEVLTAPEVVSFAELPLPFGYRAAFLAELQLFRGEAPEAEALLDKARLNEVLVGHRIHPLFSKGRVYLETARAEHALAEFLAAGEIAKSIGIENPGFCPWRSHAALALHRLGRVDEARELGREELELSRRWGAPRAIGVSLRALGAIEVGAACEQALREAVEL